MNKNVFRLLYKIILCDMVIYSRNLANCIENPGFFVGVLGRVRSACYGSDWIFIWFIKLEYSIFTGILSWLVIDGRMMTLTHEEKLNFMRTLNWDYLDEHEDMLAVIEGRLESSGAFNRDKLFVRSLERMPWHYVVALWGVETIKQLYTPEIAKRIWPKSRRYHFDFALAVLRREPLPPTRWGDEHYKQMWRPVFSNRWYCT